VLPSVSINRSSIVSPLLCRRSEGDPLAPVRRSAAVRNLCDSGASYKQYRCDVDSLLLVRNTEGAAARAGEGSQKPVDNIRAPLATG
jgi:hypothetical protein